MKHLVAVGLAALVGSTQAVTLFSNGPVVDAQGLSILGPGNSTIGVLSNLPSTLADNFTITGPAWNVESLDFFAYQTTAIGFTFTGVTWSIRSGTEINTATVVASGSTSVTNGGLVGHRVTATTLASTTRPIYRIHADIPDLALPAGSYFVTWGLTGFVASGPFVTPVLGSLGSGNAMQSMGLGFAPVVDGLSQLPYDVPFAVLGNVSAVPEPSTPALWLAGAGVLAAWRQRRRPARE